jgi:hypothetical protein
MSSWRVLSFIVREFKEIVPPTVFFGIPALLRNVADFAKTTIDYDKQPILARPARAQPLFGRFIASGDGRR